MQISKEDIVRSLFLNLVIANAKPPLLITARSESRWERMGIKIINKNDETPKFQWDCIV